MDLRSWGRRALIVSVSFVLAGALTVPAPPAAGQGICPTGGPGPGDPHPGPAVPFIGGRVTNDDGVPIAGVAVQLVRCVAGAPLPSGIALTQPDGAFAFASLSASGSYVVYVPLEGVLAGLAPTANTLNPSWVIDGAAGDDRVDMAFE